MKSFDISSYEIIYQSISYSGIIYQYDYMHIDCHANILFDPAITTIYNLINFNASGYRDCDPNCRENQELSGGV